VPAKHTSDDTRADARQRRVGVALDAAQRLFCRKGYQQTTMEEIAKDAGLSVGTLYNMFEDKERIYAQVSLRIGQAVLGRLGPLADYEDSEQAVQDLIRLLLHNYVDDRLFFQPFCFPAYLRIQPEPERLGDEVNALYREYVALVEGVFDRCRTGSGRKQKSSVQMATYVEGLITAFMGYWSGPVQSERLTKVARQIKDMLLRGLNIPSSAAEEPEVPASAESRALYITRYDLERLQELIQVVRTFGRDEWLPNAEVLETVLARARVTNPREVPPDVVTMNSRVEIQNLDLRTEQILTLVFPKDADESPDKMSILSPVGMAMFGRRVGDVFCATENDREVRYRLLRILYQPEAAGDFTL